MDRPLGRAVGNAVEVIEAIETLKGRGPQDTEQLSVYLAARMLVVGGLAMNHDEAETRVRGVLNSGAGLERFRRIIEAQGGDGRVVDDYSRLPGATSQATVTAPATGRLASLDAGHVGRAAVALGAGRDRVDADVDPSAGIEILLPWGADVRAGEVVAVVSGSDLARVEVACRLLAEGIGVMDDVPSPEPLIRETLDGASPA
jgi:pyrimidine-nucleoside phosphorylase